MKYPASAVIIPFRITYRATYEVLINYTLLNAGKRILEMLAADVWYRGKYGHFCEPEYVLSNSEAETQQSNTTHILYVHFCRP